MADIAITAANVLRSSSSTPPRRSIAGAALTQGQYIYLDSAASDVAKLADAGAAATAGVVGVTINAASTGQPVEWIEADPDFTPGGTVVEGTLYCLSDTAGAMCPIADLTTGDAVIPLGVGLANNKMHLRPIVSAATVPA